MKALVAGALGIVGSNIAAHLQAKGWDVVGMARSQPRQPVDWRLANVDLADAAACRKLVSAEQGITHLFYAARAPVPEDQAAEAAKNLGMLVAQDALLPWRRVIDNVLVAGTARVTF